MIAAKALMLSALLLLFLNAGFAQGRPDEVISAALKSGNASGVSRHFGPSVDITINNSSSTYSRTQGELVLHDFFTKNAVRDFEIQHSSGSGGGGVIFIIGYLHTSNGRYKVSMWLRPRDGGLLLKEIRFEK